jgi:hypothetical protein
MTDPFNFVAGFLIKFSILSVICAETYGWGCYNYTDATVYTASLDGCIQDPDGKWTDFCEEYDNYCYGLFCDDDQYFNDDWECVNDNYPLENNVYNFGIVYFHDDSPNYTISTMSQEYFKELKTRVKNHDPSVNFRKFLDVAVVDYYPRFFYRNLYAAFTFEKNIMLFLVNVKNNSRSNPDVLMVDYQCSLVYIRLMMTDISQNVGHLSKSQLLTWTWTLTILSSSSLFMVAIFYARIRELRNNIIGKFVLLLAICDGIKMIAANAPEQSTVRSLIVDYFDKTNTIWFLAIAYETFVILKYICFT